MSAVQLLTNVTHVMLTDAISAFLEMELSDTKPQTVTWYQKRLNGFHKKVGNVRLVDLLEADIWTWHASLKARKLSEYTRHGHIRSVKRLFVWLEKRNLTPNLARDLKLPRLPKQGKKGISDSNALAMLRAASRNKRDYAIMLFIESTACRRAGVASLLMENIDVYAPEPHCRRATVLEKGSKERVVVMSPLALHAMRAWLRERRSKSEFVFTSQESGSEGEGLSPDGISEMFDRYKSDLGLTGKCSPHQWRHRKLRRFTQDGMPLNLVSQIAGHRSVSVTSDFYGMFAMAELQNAYDRWNDEPQIEPENDKAPPDTASPEGDPESDTGPKSVV